MSGPLDEELARLAGEGVQSLLLEGGPTLATAFVAGGLVDKLVLFVAPTLAGRGPRWLGELPEPLGAPAAVEPSGWARTLSSPPTSATPGGPCA